MKLYKKSFVWEHLATCPSGRETQIERRVLVKKFEQRPSFEPRFWLM
jgi:hypothetical protein